MISAHVLQIEEKKKKIEKRTILYWEQVRSLINDLTGMQVEKRAVMKFINIMEPRMKEMILKSAEIHKTHNFERKRRRLHQKKRLTEWDMEKAEEFIFSNQDVPHEVKTEKLREKEEKERTPEVM